MKDITSKNNAETLTSGSRKKLIRGAFLRLMINNVLILIATCACGFIDALYIGRGLGKDALAAVAFFSPVSVAVGFSYVLILGTQVLSGNLVGAGETKAVNRLFVSVFTVMALLFAAFSAACLFFSGPLATLLGANGEAYVQLCDYIRGYAPGIVPQTLAALLLALCSFNNDLKRSYFSIAAMIFGNILGDWLMIKSLGLFGIGLASTISSTASLAILLPGFFKKDKLFHFQTRDGFDFRLVLKAAARGTSSLMFSIGLIIKNYSFNYALNHYTGAAGVAVAGIMASVCAVIGAIPGGVTGAFSTLGGIYYGEQDKESYLDLMRIALRIGLIICTAAMGVLMLLSAPLSQMFVPKDEAVRDMARRMFLLAFSFLIPNVFYGLLIQSYRVQDRMLLVNILSVAENTLIGLFVLVSVKPLGTDAAWLSTTVIDTLCIVIVLISVLYYRKKFDLSLPALLKLPDGFGAREGEYMTGSALTMEDVRSISEEAVAFCEKNGYSQKTAFYVGLCIEEMAGNVLEHGFRRAGCRADVRLVSKNSELTIRVRDNCREFDPRKRIDLFDPEHPEKNVGIRIVAKTARNIDYYNSAGINTLIMKY